MCRDKMVDKVMSLQRRVSGLIGCLGPSCLPCRVRGWSQVASAVSSDDDSNTSKTAESELLGILFFLFL